MNENPIKCLRSDICRCKILDSKGIKLNKYCDESFKILLKGVYCTLLI